MTKRQILFLVAGMMLALTRGGRADHKQSPEGVRPAVDARGDMLWRLHVLHVHEVEMAKIGNESGASVEVREFCGKLIDDHRKSNKDLLQMAAGHDFLVVPSGAALDELPAKHRLADRLRGMRGAELDRELISAMVRGHEQAIEMVRRDRALAGDEDVRKYLDQLMPVLQLHRDRAAALKRSMKVIKSSKLEK